MLIVGFLIAASNSGWLLEDIGIYRPLPPNQVILCENSRLYVLDESEQKILRVDPSGKMLPSFGGIGKGPGEMEQGVLDCILDDRLFVRDRHRSHAFSLSGDFLERQVGEHPNEKIYRMGGGWLIRALPAQPLTDKRETLRWRPDGGEERLILEWYSIWADFFGKDNTYRYNPVREKSLITFSPDRKRAYIRPSGKDEFHIFDVTAGEIVKTVALPQPIIPFDPDYGERMLRSYSKYVSRWGKRAVPDFPEYYPPISEVRWTAQNTLLFAQTTHEIGVYANAWVYDRHGNPTTAKLEPEWYRFLIGIRGEWAFLSSFDPEQEVVGLAKVPLTSLATELEARHSAYIAWLQGQWND